MNMIVDLPYGGCSSPHLIEFFQNFVQTVKVLGHYSQELNPEALEFWYFFNYQYFSYFLGLFVKWKPSFLQITDNMVISDDLQPISCNKKTTLFPIIITEYQIIATLLTIHISSFVPNATFLYPLKTSENLTTFGSFQDVEKDFIGNKWVKKRNVTL